MKNTISKITMLEKEQNRRKKLKLNNYNSGAKVHKKQLQFHCCNKRNRWVFGGNRSGKTECGAVETVWLLRGIHPYRENRPDLSAWSVSLSTAVQRDVAQKKILAYLDPQWIEKIVMISGSCGAAEYGIIDYILIKNVFGGLSRLGFKSCEATRDKFQGAELDFVWFDEEPPEDIYEECKMRLIDRCGEIFGTMTPLKGLTWVYNKIYLNTSNDNEIWCIFMEWADNPFLPIKEINALTASMSSEALQSRCYGRFTGGSGLVYPEFDPSIHIIEPFDVPTDWQCMISIDPGLNNPLSCHWYAVDYDGNVFVIAEHYEAKQSLEYHANRIKSICNQLNWQSDANGNFLALIDSAASQHTLNGAKSVSELFYDNGICVNTKVNKELFSGVNRVKSYLKAADGSTKLFIFNSCVNMIREIKGYRYGDNDNPKKVDDHAMDELRYFIASRPSPSFTPISNSAVTKDKQKLWRKLKN
ncbi:MAG: terminase family protein [Clostridia bacterium]